jgi:hypothetical protein
MYQRARQHAAARQEYGLEQQDGGPRLSSVVEPASFHDRSPRVAALHEGVNEAFANNAWWQIKRFSQSQELNIEVRKLVLPPRVRVRHGSVFSERHMAFQILATSDVALFGRWSLVQRVVLGE